MTIQDIEKEFDDKFKCINVDNLNCDSKGNIPVQVGEGEFEAEQCEYCFQRLFKYKDFIRTAIEKALKECEPKEKDLGWETITEKDREIKQQERAYNQAIIQYQDNVKKFLNKVKN